jgi:hypothetical protein
MICQPPGAFFYREETGQEPETDDHPGNGEDTGHDPCVSHDRITDPGLCRGRIFRTGEDQTLTDFCMRTRGTRCPGVKRGRTLPAGT